MNLFDFMGAPSQGHSPTSQAAARAVGGRAATLRREVLDFLRARGREGATDEEMQLLLPMGASTQRPRRVELVAAGLARDSGATRRTRSGRRAVVWEAVS